MQTKTDKSKQFCFAAVALILISYIAQRTFNVFIDTTANAVVAQAIVFSLMTAAVMLIMLKTKDEFYSILIAIFGLRMMPPAIDGIDSISLESGLLYFIVRSFAAFVFAVAIIWFYTKQKDSGGINCVAIVCSIFIVPFFNGVQSGVASYLNKLTQGNLIYSYFTGFIFYSAAMIILLFAASRFGYKNARLIMDYQMTALIVNFARRVCAIIINAYNGTHISRSYYCWLAIYAFFFAAFFILRRKKALSADKPAESA